MFYEDLGDYAGFLPWRFQNLIEINAIDSVVNKAIDGINRIVQENVDNKSIAFSDEKGVERWEKILGVSTPINAELSARKEALKSRLMTKPPINLLTLKEIIETYMGVGIEISIEGFEITCKYRGMAKVSDLRPLYVTIYQTIPANLILNIKYAYLTFDELDAQGLTFDELSAKNLTFAEFERGEWIE